jgi:hypothetical protein
MPSPFPGMDPYLEEPSLFPDFHGSMVPAMRAALSAVLPEGYTAYLDRYVYLQEPDGGPRVRQGKPEVYVAQRVPAAVGASAATLDAPAMVTLPFVRQEGPLYLRIVDRTGRRIVTVIELLSPTNKETGPDREQYLTKRNEYLATRTNLVEIDLLRAGRRMPLGEPPPAPSDYLLFVSRAADYPQAGVWPFSVRDPLPVVPVPLNPQDGWVTFALKPCLDRVYDEAHYALDLDYTVPPVPPLREPDASWARELLATRTAPPTSSQGNPT